MHIKCMLYKKQIKQIKYIILLLQRKQYDIVFVYVTKPILELKN